MGLFQINKNRISFSIPCYYIFLSLFFSASVTQCLCAREENGKSRILILVAASDHSREDIEKQKIWSSYMHSDPDRIQSYFIKCKSDLNEEFRIEKDVVWCKQAEMNLPDIYTKDVLENQILALEYLYKVGIQADYIVFTSSSSFFVLPRLLKFLKTPKENQCFVPLFMSGCACPGFIVSSDLTEYIIQNKDQIVDFPTEPDAVPIHFLIKTNIPIQPFYNVFEIPFVTRWYAYKNCIHESFFHFHGGFVDPVQNSYFFWGRSLNHHFPEDMLFVMAQLLKTYYGIDSPYPMDLEKFETQEMLWKLSPLPWRNWSYQNE